MFVYTMAEREYAAEVLKIIDPISNMFKDRIVSRKDFPNPKSKLEKFM